MMIRFLFAAGGFAGGIVAALIVAAVVNRGAVERLDAAERELAETRATIETERTESTRRFDAVKAQTAREVARERADGRRWVEDTAEEARRAHIEAERAKADLTDSRAGWRLVGEWRATKTPGKSEPITVAMPTALRIRWVADGAVDRDAVYVLLVDEAGEKVAEFSGWGTHWRTVERVEPGRYTVIYCVGDQPDTPADATATVYVEQQADLAAYQRRILELTAAIEVAEAAAREGKREAEKAKAAAKRRDPTGRTGPIGMQRPHPDYGGDPRAPRQPPAWWVHQQTKDGKTSIEITPPRGRFAR